MPRHNDSQKMQDQTPQEIPVVRRLEEARRRLQQPAAVTKNAGAGALSMGVELVAGLVVSMVLAWGLGELVQSSVFVRLCAGVLLGATVNAWGFYKRIRGLL